MKPLTIIIGLIFLLGCTPEIIYLNNTEIIYHNKTIIREEIQFLPTECPKEKICPPVKQCPPVTKCPSFDTKLNLCHMRLDVMNDQLFDCLLQNTTQFSENLSIEYDRCLDDREELENKLNNITEVLK